MPMKNATQARPRKRAELYSGLALASLAGMVIAGIWSPLLALPFGAAGLVMYLKAICWEEA